VRAWRTLTGAQDDMYEYCTRTRRTLREVLEDFRSVRIPRAYVFDVFPPMRPRLFSIASSLRVRTASPARAPVLTALQAHPGEVHLCVAIVRYRTKLRLARTGVCTAYLARLPPGAVLPLDVQAGTLVLPPAGAPALCVGPGTGVAPMRALLEERSAPGDALYFGCRGAAHDQHFAADWARMAEAGALRYRLAASRDGPEGTARTYVQHLIEADAQEVDDAVRARRGWVYISGAANKMPLAVKGALRAALAKAGGMGEDAAAEYVRQMEAEGRLWEECWG
jgi:sulfite reductase alpha subunit-like flavoprotein